MSFAKNVFRGAGIYGLLAVAPMYFLFDRIGQDYPPAITHPEYFYGFVGVALAWQFAFLVIGSDPIRYRGLMPPAMLEKASFGIAAILLYLQGRVNGSTVFFGSIDLLLGLLFAAAWLRTPRASSSWSR